MKTLYLACAVLLLAIPVLVAGQAVAPDPGMPMPAPHEPTPVKPDPGMVVVPPATDPGAIALPPKNVDPQIDKARPRIDRRNALKDREDPAAGKKRRRPADKASKPDRHRQPQGE